MPAASGNGKQAFTPTLNDLTKTPLQQVRIPTGPPACLGKRETRLTAKMQTEREENGKLNMYIMCAHRQYSMVKIMRYDSGRWKLLASSMERIGRTGRLMENSGSRTLLIIVTQWKDLE